MVRACLFALPLSLALSLSFAPISQAQTAPGGQGGPLSVGTVSLTPEDVPMVVNLSGVAVASESAQIRPLVQGVVQEILYRPDQPMKVGDPMFRIDPTSYQAALAAAEASVQSAEAARDDAQANADRYDALAGRGVTQADAGTARAALLQAEAAVAVAKADLSTAEFNMNNTTIKSPIEGQASVPAVSVGDLVTSGQSDVLATVTRLDPIYADLADTSARMLRLRSMFEAGTLQPGDALGVALVLENGQTVDGQGEVISVGDTVSTSTGTFNVRVEIANPVRLILPGMFVSARLTFGKHQALLIPQVAAQPQPDGSIAIYVVEGGKAVEKSVFPSGSTDDAWIVPDRLAGDLADGAQLIVDNRDNLRDGIEVAPVAVTISTGGVITQAGDAPAADLKASAADMPAQAETTPTDPAQPAVTQDDAPADAAASAAGQ